MKERSRVGGNLWHIRAGGRVKKNDTIVQILTLFRGVRLALPSQKRVAPALLETQHIQPYYGIAKNSTHGPVVAGLQKPAGQYSFLPAPVRHGNQGDRDVI